MFDFQQKRQLKRVLYSKVSIGILLVLVFFLARSTYDIAMRQRLSAESFHESVREHESLKSRETHLATSLTRLATDEGIEEEIRSKFSVSRPGEVVVTVIGDSQVPAHAQKKGIWETVKSWFAE